MKKMCLVFALFIALFIPKAVYANMAAPKDADIGSSITFEKNDTLSVLSEVLDISVNGSKANIVATYKMKNTTNDRISTQSMFLSPNIETSGVQVMVNGRDTPFQSKSYVLNYTTEVEMIDWQYVVLTYNNTSLSEEKTADSVTFEMVFEPGEEYDVVVSYVYRLGGYPEYDFDAKMGEIKYYLAPAAMWKDFENITINLYLDKDMPVISSSNLEFEKVGTRTYQYISSTLPDEDLKIIIDENWFQNIFSTLRNPYLRMGFIVLSPVILIVLAVIIFMIRHRYKKLFS